MAQASRKTFQFVIDRTTHEITLIEGSGHFLIQMGRREFEVRAQTISPHCLSLSLDRRAVTVYLASDKTKRYICVAGRQFVLEEVHGSSMDPTNPQAQVSGADDALTSPMPGQVVKIEVREGDVVDKNQTLAIVEAMKMENELKASGRARVKQIHAVAGDLVDAGQVIVELEKE